MNTQSIDRLIRELPKAELHLHIEGTLEPEMMFAFARRNGVNLPYADVDDVRKAYSFGDLQSFLDLYYAGAGVLVTERDFYELTLAYCERAHADTIVHTEIFFDPQTHLVRGVTFETFVRGISRALSDAKRNFGMSSRLIMCFLRHLPEDDGFRALEEAMPFLDLIHGVGLDSGERGNPPSKFARLFERCRSLGLPVVAHAGEEGPAPYISEALDILRARRIDHGVRSSEDPSLVSRLARDRIPLTVCPLSNLKLKVFGRMSDHNLKKLLDEGLCVTVNSDDPAYFGGYLNDNLLECRKALGLDGDDVIRLIQNSFEASWLSEEDKKRWMDEVKRKASELGNQD